MNTVVTSREAILGASRDLIRKQGWKAVNIRTIARECNICTGSIYNLSAPARQTAQQILRKRLLHNGDETLKSWKPLLNTIFVQRLIGMFCAIECAQYLLCCLPGRGNGQNLWHPDQISFYSLESLYPIPRAVKSHLGREGFSSIFSRSLRI